MTEDYKKVSVIIIGAGPAGLAAAIQLKTEKPDIDVCVVEKAADLGNHNLSGAVLESEPLHTLLDSALPDWQETADAKKLFGRKVEKDNIMFLSGKTLSFNIFALIKFASMFRINFGQMMHKGDYIVSVSKLTKWLGTIAKQLGAEILTGFAVEDILLEGSKNTSAAVKLVDQGRDRDGNEQPNYVEGETIRADFIVLAEGCDGLVTEKFIEKASLQRQSAQLYSVAVKEIIKVTARQYEKFGDNRVVHAMGYPLWTPLLGPGMFGGGIVYPLADEHLAVGMIVGADWKYYDFNPQDALTNFKEHRFVKQFIKGGTVVEAGAKMIPEGGYYAIPRDSKTGSIGKDNVIIAGDSAGFVNMLKIKGLHNAIDSGIQAAKAITQTFNNPKETATKYTELIDSSCVAAEMVSAKNFRQTVAKFGPLQGMPLSVFGSLLAEFKVEKDYQAMKSSRYRLKPPQQFDKDTFAAMAATEHREDQPCHLKIQDDQICTAQCTALYENPCITFCPAGVYETVQQQVKPANPSNCLHCKTCQRKCPFDNIRWTVPEGGGGPRYKRM
ncbi:MAG: FAD-dependent oxidoreductase [Sedimentisphaerales bacterium]|nr:FAD-dependent oxidoreductase [Sedimentisphaerales bacterium]